MKKLSMAALAVAVTAIGAGGVVANAAPTTQISPDDVGSLTIHKFAQPPNYGSDNLGMLLDPAHTTGWAPLAGAEFTTRQVTGVDLTTNSGWKEAQAVVDAFDPFNPAAITEHGHGLVNSQQAVTNAKGEARLANLPVGLYLVEETGAPPVGANTTVTKSMPFLITVPLTNPENSSEWIYDVHAYPKNVLSSVIKTVTDGDTFSLGQRVLFDVAGTIPGGSVTTKYVLTDQLDERLQYESVTVLVGGKSTGDFSASHADGLLTVTLGSSARAEAFASLSKDPDSKVIAQITATVKQAGEIPNDASLTFQRAGETETHVTSPKVETKFGGVTVTKHSRSGKALPGAVFEVRGSHSASFATAKSISVSGKSQWTTGSDGKVLIDGIRYSAWANGGVVSKDSPLYNHYWLVEVKAPTGYELAPEPIPLVIESPIASAATIDVVNVEHNAGGTLPLTGAEGTTKLAGIGALFVLVGGTSMYLSNRRRTTKRELTR